MKHARTGSAQVLSAGDLKTARRVKAPSLLRSGTLVGGVRKPSYGQLCIAQIHQRVEGSGLRMPIAPLPYLYFIF